MSALTEQQKKDIDNLVGGKVDNSHDAGGPDMDEHECGCAVIYDCVHYMEGVIEEISLQHDDDLADSIWLTLPASEWKRDVVDYIRERYPA